MNTQNTTIHVRLWHREFWLMAIANLLLSLSVTMLLPTMPLWMLYTEGLSEGETAIAMAAFGVGLFLPGCFSAWLVQRFRRNIVCVWAVLALAFSLAVCLWPPFHLMSFGWVVALRVGQGACFGLAQMVLTSTLIIDTCESFQRTEANHSATWFARFALSLGPMTGLVLYGLQGFTLVSLVAAGCAVASAVLILLVHFPFRVPQEGVHVISLDRFLLMQGMPLVFNLLLITIAAGVVLSLPLDAFFFALMMGGFFLALLAQRFVFRDAELESEVVSGLILIAAAIIILLESPRSPLCSPLFGLGLGLVGGRFLLFFIKLSRHCQRGTAQSTFMLSWECGIAFGFGMGFAIPSRTNRLSLALCLVGIAMIAYRLFTHSWFLRNKNR